MKIKKSNAFASVDIIIAVIAAIIFSVLIVSLMYYNALENKKIKKETLASIYLTETLENIGIASYNEVSNENINNLIPAQLEEDGYTMNIQVTSNFNGLSENIIKKVNATISYTIQNKKYEYSMQRIKIKE